MKKLFFFLVSFLCVTLWSCSDDNGPAVVEKQDAVVSFEDKLSAGNTYYLATEGEQYNDYYMVASFQDDKNLVGFTHYFASWGFGGGFTYSNLTDITTPGYNNLSAITGKGTDGSVYLTAGTSNAATITNLNPSAYQFKGAYVTNATYAYLAIHDGNDGNTPAYAKKFDANDWFKLTATGYAASGTEIGSVTFDLATGTAIVNTWEWFDWTPIASAAYITFTMTSSDTGDWGMNTPAYFCMDGITLTEK